MLTAGTKLGRYEIRSKIGEGGMGEVYLAQDTKLDRKVALKILPAEVAANQDRMRRFIQEAKAASALNHPNIITIHEIDQTASGHFIATEFIDGETLRKHLRRETMKLSHTLEVAIQVASALAGAHAVGIVHRDIKPENVMLRRDGIVKVLDFGLAKLVFRKEAVVDTSAPTAMRVRTDPGTVLGTSTYMSPEQSSGSLNVDHRTDIWSLGAMLYEMVTGRVPFSGKDLHREIIAIQEQEAAPLSRYAEGVPDRLEEIVRKTLAKDPNERYQTAQDLVIDLRNLKRRLEVDAEIDRTVPPEFRDVPGKSRNSSQTATASGSVATTVSAGTAQPVLSVEYIVTKIRLHKVAMFLGLAALVFASVALAAYLRARDTEAPIDSIAVLPFVNQNHDPDSEYVSDGVTESIINSLTQLPNLKVIARSSVFRYKDKDADPIKVGKELGVSAILTGRIMQRGDNVAVSTELVDVRNDKQLWGEQYNEKVSDLISLPREIAAKITSNLRLTISSEARNRMMKHYTDNPEAYQLYLKGRYYWNKRNAEALKKSIEYFNQAIEKDPTYALAYSGLADAYGLLPPFAGGSPQEFAPKAKAAAKKAVELDDSLAEAHTSLAAMIASFDWNWSEATIEFQRAITLNPNYATAHHWYSDGPLLALGRFSEANAEMKRAQELDPLSLIINAEVGSNYIYERQYDRAIEQLRKTLEMDQNFYYAHWNLGFAYAMKGAFPDALAEYQTALRLVEDPAVLGLMGHAYAMSGKRDEALRTVNRLKEISQHRYVQAYALAQVYAALGEKDQAFLWLEKSYQDHAPEMAMIKVDPTLDNLRSDSRFQDLIRRMNLDTG